MNFLKEGLGIEIKEEVTETGIEKCIHIPSGYTYLDSVFDTFPDNSFLCKSVAGVGGTYLAITNPEDYVIAGSSVELILNKIARHNNLIGVYGEMSIQDILNMISISKLKQVPVKIITTYDSLPKVVTALGGSVNEYKLLVDELQVLLKASDEFKPEVVTKLFSVVGLFKSVCYMTATPTPRKYFPPEVANLDYYRVTWEDSKKMLIKKSRVSGDMTSKVTAIALHHLDNGGTPLFFYNSLRGIIPCIKNLIKCRGLTHKDIKIICADNENNRNFLKEQLGDEWIPEKPLYKDVDTDDNEFLNPRNKPIQFCTKYAFEGLDFLVDDAYTYVISDVRNKHRHHTRIDISTDLQQIAGRCRNSNPLVKREATFLWNDSVEGVELTEEQYEEFVRDELAIAKDMEQRYTLEKMRSMKIKFESSPYFVEVDGKIITNDYAIYGLCIAYASLTVGYVNVMVGGEEHSKVEEHLNLFSETEGFTLPQLKITDKAKLEKKQSFKELAEEYYEVYLELKECKTDLCRVELQDQLTLLKTLDKEFGEIVDAIGIEEIKSTSFHKTKSKAKYRKVVGVEAVSSSKSKAYKNLRVKEGGFYTYSELREKLQACFDKFNIKTKAKATDIKMVYNVKRTMRGGVEGFLIGDKI